MCAEFPFTSDWKRMSMIIWDGEQYYLFCKGADTIMLPRINFGGGNTATED